MPRIDDTFKEEANSDYIQFSIKSNHKKYTKDFSAYNLKFVESENKNKNSKKTNSLKKFSNILAFNNTINTKLKTNKSQKDQSSDKIDRIFSIALDNKKSNDSKSHCKKYDRSLETTGTTNKTVERQEKNSKLFLNFDRDDGVEFPPWYISTRGLSRPSSPEKLSEQRYFDLVNNCISDDMISSLANELIESIVERVNNLELIQNRKDSVLLFKKDIYAHYYWSMKKSILDYILKNKEEQIRLGLNMIHKVSITAGRFGYPWHESLVKNKNTIKLRLFAYHPCLHSIYYSFNKKYFEFRMIDLDFIKTQMPLTLDEFSSMIKQQTEKNRNFIIENWLSECADIISNQREEIENYLSQDENVSSLHLYKAILKTIFY